MDRVGNRGRGESVWLAWFLIATIRNFTRHCLDESQTEFRDRWNGRADSLAAAVERSAWDGEWYLRAFDDDGRAWGTSEEQECRIDSIAQSWSILSGAGDPERARSVLGQAVQAGFQARLVRVDGSPLLHVRVGSFGDRPAAQAVLDRLSAASIEGAVVRDPRPERPTP